MSFIQITFLTSKLGMLRTVVRVYNQDKVNCTKITMFVYCTSYQGGMHAGILTVQGRDQAYVLGKRLRKQYMDDLKFVGPEYNPAEV